MIEVCVIYRACDLSYLVCAQDTHNYLRVYIPMLTSKTLIITFNCQINGKGLPMRTGGDKAMFCLGGGGEGSQSSR